MKYIRAKDGIYEVEGWFKPLENDMVYIPNEGLNKILNQADTIEELCDRCIVIRQFDDFYKIGSFYECEYEIDCFKRKVKSNNPIIAIYGAMWTDKGLIYVAKMNDKGELELL